MSLSATCMLESVILLKWEIYSTKVREVNRYYNRNNGIDGRVN